MSKILLLSGPDKTKYLSKEISMEIKNNIDKPINMVTIASTPDNYEKNDKYFYGDETVVGVIRTFKKIFPDINISLLDSRVNLEEGRNSLMKADIIYLLGGNPFTQLEYLKENKFDDVIRKTSCLIIGASAGSMNLATNAYYSKDEDYTESIMYNGIGVTDITIDPHFDINNKEQVNEIEKNSKNIRIIGLPNESVVSIFNNEIKYIGDIYIYENGKLKSF